MKNNDTLAKEFDFDHRLSPVNPPLFAGFIDSNDNLSKLISSYVLNKEGIEGKLNDHEATDALAPLR